MSENLSTMLNVACLMQGILCAIHFYWLDQNLNCILKGKNNGVIIIFYHMSCLKGLLFHFSISCEFYYFRNCTNLLINSSILMKIN